MKQVLAAIWHWVVWCIEMIIGSGPSDRPIAIDEPSPPFVVPGEIVRHRRRGTVYTVVSAGLDSDTRKQVVIYRSVSEQQVWVRPVAEFVDGRFEKVEREHDESTDSIDVSVSFAAAGHCNYAAEQTDRGVDIFGGDFRVTVYRIENPRLVKSPQGYYALCKEQQDEVDVALDVARTVAIGIGRKRPDSIDIRQRFNDLWSLP